MVVDKIPLGKLSMSVFEKLVKLHFYGGLMILFINYDQKNSLSKNYHTFAMHVSENQIS